MLDPLGSGERLAFRTMPVPARVIGNALMLATVAPLQVTAQGGGATGFDGLHHAALRARQGRIVLDTIRLAIAAQHVRHLQGGPLHGKKRLKVLGRGCRLRWWQRVRQQIQWARGRTDLRDGDTQVACSCRQRSVSHLQLDRAQVLPGLQQMTRVTSTSTRSEW